MNRGYGISMDEKHLPEFCCAIKNTLEQNRAKILSFPYLSEQKDLRFIMWSLISRIVWDFTERVNRVLAKTYFSDITPLKRNFSCVAVAYTDEQHPAFDFYGCDGINVTSVGGYQNTIESDRGVYCRRDFVNAGKPHWSRGDVDDRGKIAGLCIGMRRFLKSDSPARFYIHFTQA